MENSFQIPLSPSPSETPLDDFIIDDLLNIPNDDTAPAIHGSSSTDSSSSSDVRDFQNNGGGIVAAVAAATGGSSSSSTTNESSAAVVAGNRQFAAEFGVPLEDLAELEWLSNFVEDSFSSTDEGLHKLQLAQGFQARPDDLPYFQPDASRPSPCPSPTPSPIPAKARSKRSRPAPGNWTSRLLVVSPPVTPTTTSSSDSFDTITASMAKKPLAKRSKKEGGGGAGRGGGGGADGEGRRCLHCATDKTPQWRTGPMGPKTLCNACGVRYKSGRLVPEYRPAASPTFMLTKHSNSHRKVLELRRQKEMMRAQPQHHQHQPFMNHHHHHQQHQQPSMIFDASTNREDYLIHQHVGPDFRHLI